VPTATGQALLVLVIFVLPGFVTLLFKERIHEVAVERSGFEMLFSALFYSLLVYAPLVVLGAIIGLDRNDIVRIYTARDGLWPLLGVGLLAGIVLPFLVAYSSHRWQASDLRTTVLGRLQIATAHRIPTAWDYFFGYRLPALLRITLETGEVVAGYYAGMSFATYAAHGGDIYIQEQWELEAGTFQMVGPVEGSMGIWVPGSQITQVEIFAVTEEHRRLFRQAGLAGVLDEIMDEVDEENANGDHDS
jgi:hypothetical protein